MLFDRIFRFPGRVSLPSRQGGPTRGVARSQALDDSFLSRLRNVTLVSQRKLTSGLTGEHASPRRAHALEFADYRSYTPGDDLRRVDWNAYLRLGQLLVKLADAPERVTLHLLLDTSGSMAWGHPDKFSFARKVAGGLAYVALSHMDAASLIVLRDRDCTRWSRQESSASAAAMVRAINALEPGGTTDLDAALSAYTSLSNHRGIAVLITDLLSPQGYQSGLERLSHAALRPVVIHVLSPEEINPTLEGDLELLDAETGETVQVSVDWGILRRYRRWLREWLNEIEAYCAGRGITYIRVESSHPIEQLLLERLRREKVLK